MKSRKQLFCISLKGKAGIASLDVHQVLWPRLIQTLMLASSHVPCILRSPGHHHLTPGSLHWVLLFSCSLCPRSSQGDLINLRIPGVAFKASIHVPSPNHSHSFPNIPTGSPINLQAFKNRQAWAQSPCPELSAQGLVPLRWGCTFYQIPLAAARTQ